MRKLLAVILLSVIISQAVFSQDSNKTKPHKPAQTNTAAAKHQLAKPAQTTAAPVTAVQKPNPYALVPVSTDKSLAGQYQYVLSKTYHYQQPMISALWKNMNDTLNAERRKLKEVTAKLAGQGKSMADLQTDLNSKTQSLSDANARRDEISLLGINLPKTTYNLIMWGLVIGLAVVLTVVILRTAGNSREAKYRTKLYEELSEEFQAYKVKANDKEKKLARELQTERNKVDELMGRG